MAPLAEDWVSAQISECQARIGNIRLALHQDEERRTELQKLLEAMSLLEAPHLEALKDDMEVVREQIKELNAKMQKNRDELGLLLKRLQALNALESELKNV